MSPVPNSDPQRTFSQAWLDFHADDLPEEGDPFDPFADDEDPEPDDWAEGEDAARVTPDSQEGTVEDRWHWYKQTAGSDPLSWGAWLRAGQPVPEEA